MPKIKWMQSKKGNLEVYSILFPIKKKKEEWFKIPGLPSKCLLQDYWVRNIVWDICFRFKSDVAIFTFTLYLRLQFHHS